MLILLVYVSEVLYFKFIEFCFSWFFDGSVVFNIWLLFGGGVC